jgi:hypothetical protein
VTSRFTFLLVVTFVSACGAGARPKAAASAPTSPGLAEPATRTAAELNPDDDYVVGPFETPNAGVRTYYIVRN